jgi:L,D-peptidoglycan transpeptidase YkuD (ErfK/YbiS/YcfS/YnhG family)
VFGAAAGVAAPESFAPVRLITVSPSSPHILTCGFVSSPCAIGWGGVRHDKHEGDGATPAGHFQLRRVMVRRDRVPSVVSRLPISPIDMRDGWSTDPNDPFYNQQITLPRPGQHENLWRTDGLYDVIIVIGYNDAPAAPGRGSAIFLHVARAGLSPTDGCIAVPLPVILTIAKLCDETTYIDIKI